MAALPKPRFAISHSKAQAPVATTPAAVASAANLAAATVTGGQAIRPEQLGTFIFLNFLIFRFNEFLGLRFFFCGQHLLSYINSELGTF